MADPPDTFPDLPLPLAERWTADQWTSVFTYRHISISDVLRALGLPVPEHLGSSTTDLVKFGDAIYDELSEQISKLVKDVVARVHANDEEKVVEVMAATAADATVLAKEIKGMINGIGYNIWTGGKGRIAIHLRQWIFLTAFEILRPRSKKDKAIKSGKRKWEFVQDGPLSKRVKTSSNHLEPPLSLNQMALTSHPPASPPINSQAPNQIRHDDQKSSPGFEILEYQSSLPLQSPPTNIPPLDILLKKHYLRSNSSNLDEATLLSYLNHAWERNPQTFCKNAAHMTPFAEVLEAWLTWRRSAIRVKSYIAAIPTDPEREWMFRAGICSELRRLREEFLEMRVEIQGREMGAKNVICTVLGNVMGLDAKKNMQVLKTLRERICGEEVELVGLETSPHRVGGGEEVGTD